MKEAIQEVGKETLIETALGFGAETFIEWVKEQGLSLAAETALNLGISGVPVLGQAISNFRTSRAIKNLEVQVKLLQDHQAELRSNLSKLSSETKNQLDQVFAYMLEKTIIERQQEKIAYFTNSFVGLTQLETIDVDISYIYYDTLSQMTMLDIKGLIELGRGAFYYYQHPDSEPIVGNDISNEQFQAIKSNLVRLGLVENEYDKKLGEDMKDILTTMSEYREAIVAIEALLDKGKGKMQGIKNKSKAKVPKLKAKNKLVISPFGREMIAFFSESGKVVE